MSVLSEADVPSAAANGLIALMQMSGELPTVLEKMRVCDTMQAAYREFKQTSDALLGTPVGEALGLDFSITNDARYYNGLLMRGYIDGIARAVLSGGRYDWEMFSKVQ